MMCRQTTLGLARCDIEAFLLVFPHWAETRGRVGSASLQPLTHAMKPPIPGRVVTFAIVGGEREVAGGGAVTEASLRPLRGKGVVEGTWQRE